jgi:hypothetical protein
MIVAEQDALTALAPLFFHSCAIQRRGQSRVISVPSPGSNSCGPEQGFVRQDIMTFMI